MEGRRGRPAIPRSHPRFSRRMTATQPAAAPPGTETMLCDTSFVSVVQSSAHPRNAASIAAWPQEAKDRLNAAILAISVISLAELRDGHIWGKWLPARRAQAERVISS